MAYSILIVDDSATTRAMIKRTIQLAQLPVQCLFEAGDGQAALDILSRESIDLVLADLNMPGMDGVEMTQRMRQSDRLRSIPVLVVSANPDLHLLERLADQGVQGFVRKPFTPENLRSAVSRQLGVCHA